jgi:ABC-type dipeptide/oligopeptide/nickel transport system permease component
MKTFLLQIFSLLIALPFGIWGVLALRFGSWPDRVYTGLAVFYGSAFLFAILIAPPRRIFPILTGGLVYNIWDNEYVSEMDYSTRFNRIYFRHMKHVYGCGKLFVKHIMGREFK